MVREVITPRRRSSRLRGMSPQKQSTPAAHLTALEEREETPDRMIESLATSETPSFHTSLTSPEPESMDVKTPTTANRLGPSFEEMHPSRFQSTAKKLGQGKRLSTVNARIYMQTPSKSEAKTVETMHPSRPTNSPQKSFASPGFEFRFRPSTDMSTDTQKMMEDIREHAAKIKEGLAAQREEQTRQEDEAEALFGRKLATPKGKLGRYSDVHVGQFKKMDSIANHPSAFRADPVKAASATANTLKRSASKTSLGKIEAGLGCATAVSTKSLKRSPSKAELDKVDTPSKRVMPAFGAAKEHQETSSPTKRIKQQHDGPTPARPPQFGFAMKLTTTSLPRVKSGIPTLHMVSSITTPTKASLARSASVKNLKTTTSMIPSLARSPSMKNLTTPSTGSKPGVPHTDGNTKHANSFANKLTSVKSILRRPQIRFSDDPVKIAAGTHLSTPTKPCADDEKSTRLLPSILPSTPGTPSHRKEKHVNFTTSPSPSIIPSHPGTPDTPSPTKLPGAFPIDYPSLPGPGTPTRPSVTIARASSAAPAQRLGDFTFRSDKTISFAPLALPGRSTPTIRKVRASDAVVYSNFGAAAAVETLSQLPCVPHGLINKKRKRESVNGDADDDKENATTFTTITDVENGKQDAEAGEDIASPTKRARFTMETSPAPVKRATPGANMTMTKSATPGPSSSKIPKQKGRGFLSLSRLNALARPRERK